MSPVLNPDTTQQQDYSTPIEPGTYPARITTAEAGISKAKKPKCVVNFEVKVGDQTRKRTSHLPVTGEGTFNFDQLLRACRMDDLADAYKDPSVNPKPAFDPVSLNGVELMVVITGNVYKDDAGNEKLGDQISGYLKA